jgi:hypothetical protein
MKIHKRFTKRKSNIFKKVDMAHIFALYRQDNHTSNYELMRSNFSMNSIFVNTVRLQLASKNFKTPIAKSSSAAFDNMLNIGISGEYSIFLQFTGMKFHWVDLLKIKGHM